MQTLISRLNDLQVVPVSIRRLKGNYTGKLYRIHAKDRDAKYINVIYKQFAKHRCNEIEIYQSLYPLLPQFMPRTLQVYRTGDKAMLFEDLGQSIKTQIDVSGELQKENLLEILAKLADLHTIGQNLRGMLLKNNILINYKQVNNWMKWASPMLKELERQQFPWFSSTWITKFNEQVELFNARGIAPSGNITLTHGDPHLDNVFIKNKNVYFIDWEWATITSPLRDFTLLIQDIYDQSLVEWSIKKYQGFLKEKGYVITEDEFNNDFAYYYFENTLKMLAWDIEKFLGNFISQKELLKIISFKDRNLNFISKVE